MKNKIEWILTDNDDYQHATKLTDTKYHLIGVFGIPEGAVVSANNDSDNEEKGKYRVYERIVDIDLYVKGHCSGELEGILNSYGYESVDDVVEKYGASANQIIAECIFECCEVQTSGVIHYGDYNSCVAKIDDFIKSFDYKVNQYPDGCQLYKLKQVAGEYDEFFEECYASNICYGKFKNDTSKVIDELLESESREPIEFSKKSIKLRERQFKSIVDFDIRNIQKLIDQLNQQFEIRTTIQQLADDIYDDVLKKETFEGTEFYVFSDSLNDIHWKYDSMAEKFCD